MIIAVRQKGEKMSECMTFPDTVDEFMESYKIVDTEQVYTNGAEFVPIFRMKQWFEHIDVQPERKKGEWEMVSQHENPPTYIYRCSECRHKSFGFYNFCPNCGAQMER